MTSAIVLPPLSASSSSSGANLQATPQGSPLELLASSPTGDMQQPLLIPPAAPSALPPQPAVHEDASCHHATPSALPPQPAVHEDASCHEHQPADLAPPNLCGEGSLPLVVEEPSAPAMPLHHWGLLDIPIVPSLSEPKEPSNPRGPDGTSPYMYPAVPFLNENPLPPIEPFLMNQPSPRLDDPVVQAKSSDIVRTSPEISALAESIPDLMGLLGPKALASEREQALKALLRLAQCSREDCSAMADLDGIMIFARLLGQDPSPTVAALAAGILDCLAVNLPDHRVSIAWWSYQAGVIGSVAAHLLKPVKVDGVQPLLMHRFGIALLRHLTGSEANRVKIVSSGLVPFIVAALEHHDVTVQKNALMLLGQMIHSKEAREALLRSPNTMATLLDTKSHDNAFQLEAAKVLKVLSSGG